MAGVWMPATVRRVKATRASGDSAGWQQVKIRRSRSSVMGSGPSVTMSAGSSDRRSASVRVSRAASFSTSRRERRMRSMARRRAVVVIARAGPVRHTVVGPVLERREECVLDRFLGGVEVTAERRDEARQDASAFGAEDVLHRRGGDEGGRLRVAFRHACSIGRSIPGASIRRITDDDPPYRMSEWRSNDEGDAAVHGHGQRGDR